MGKRKIRELLKVDGLYAGYGEKIIVKDVELSLFQGEVIAVIGPNGAGKTTFLKTLGGLIEPQKGSILINGRAAGEVSIKERAKLMALMLTSGISFGRISCFEVASMGRHPYTGSFGVLTDDDRRTVYKALDMVQMTDFADADYNEISDGQRQRILLARAVAQEPEIMVLDEPTSYLDIHHKLDFLNIVRSLADSRKTGIIMSVHEPEFAWMTADKICALSSDGRVCITGTPEEVIRDDILGGLYGLKKNRISELYRGFAEALV